MELTLRNVSAAYRAGKTQTDVLRDLSFSVTPGRRLCVLGENGSGKTTLLRVIAGVLPYRGSVLLDGRELRERTREECGLRVALLSQMGGSYYAYTVRETVAQGRYLRRRRALFPDEKAREEDRAAVEAVLAKTGLSELKDRTIDTLSGGQRQRVFLARAFVQETPLLLLDEPANHLDLKYQAELADYLNRWSSESTRLPGGDAAHPNTVIGVFHDLVLARQIAEEVLILKDGRKLAQGDAATLLSDDALLREAFGIDVSAFILSRGVALTHIHP